MTRRDDLPSSLRAFPSLLISLLGIGRGCSAVCASFPSFLSLTELQHCLGFLLLHSRIQHGCSSFTTRAGKHGAWEKPASLRALRDFKGLLVEGGPSPGAAHPPAVPPLSRGRTSCTARHPTTPEPFAREPPLQGLSKGVCLPRLQLELKRPFGPGFMGNT